MRPPITETPPDRSLDLSKSESSVDLPIGTAMEETLKDMISEGRLIQVLKDWCPTFPGYFLYYPSRRNQPAALSALIDTLRLSD